MWHRPGVLFVVPLNSSEVADDDNERDKSGNPSCHEAAAHAAREFMANAVSIEYNVACTDERDQRPNHKGKKGESEADAEPKLDARLWAAEPSGPIRYAGEPPDLASRAQNHVSDSSNRLLHGILNTSRELRAISVN
jgi:ankyrin repeat protein